ncbi:MAG: CDP-alcohol phosphatidyltransferase family protein [Deltaproteobacteria bacterium]|nr:CDP-alcohol phosphatidyltransferase family protein [Deltaproteobacteria bacterium]
MVKTKAQTIRPKHKPFSRLPRNVAAVLTFGRPPLVFGAFVAALWVIFTQSSLAYITGLSLLAMSMLFDWVDGWFAERFNPESRLGPLVNRMMERLVFTIIFPVLGAGMLWRYTRLAEGLDARSARLLMLHALFVVAIGVLVLVRDQFSTFIRSFAIRKGEDLESYELNQLQGLVGAPMAVLLYAYAFYLPTVGWEVFYGWLDWLDQVPLRAWLVLESLFLIVTFGSMTVHLRKYGMLALDDICGDDENLRRRILAVLPNAVTMLNGVMGVAAVVFASMGLVREALFILVGAAVFDKLDGTLARRLGLAGQPGEKPGSQKITLGAILDDISDFVSFAMAPAAIFYLVMEDLTHPPDLPVGLIAGLYALAGTARLIYFTLDKTPVPGFFKGMPVPAAALLVMGPLEISSMLHRTNHPDAQAWALGATLVMVAASVAMNFYVVRWLHFGRLMSRNPMVTWGLSLLALVMVFTPFFGGMIFLLTLVYLLSPLMTWRISPAEAARERPREAKRS